MLYEADIIEKYDVLTFCNTATRHPFVSNYTHVGKTSSKMSFAFFATK